MGNKISTALLILALVVPALASDDWDTFHNNFATDLTPLLALFGEQVAKQFLSESTSVLDNIIFAVAPLGILTAVVSVIVFVETHHLEHLSEEHRKATELLKQSSAHPLVMTFVSFGIVEELPAFSVGP